MTEKKSFFSKYGIVTDLFMSVIFFLNTVSIMTFGRLYFPVMEIGPVMMWAPGILVFAFLVIRRLRINQIVMILLHLLAGWLFCTAIYYISGRAVWVVIYMIISAIANLCYSMGHRYKPDLKADGRVAYDTLYLSMIAHVVVLIALAISDSPEMVTQVTINAVYIVILYIAARQLDIFEVSYYHNLHSSTQPVGSIRKQNHLMILLIVTGILFALAALSFIPMEPLVKGLMYIIGVVVRFLISLGPKEEIRFTSEDRDVFADMPQEVAEPDPIAEMILTIIASVIIIAIAFFVFYIIINWLSRLFRNFSNASDVKAVTEDKAITDIVESIRPGPFGRHRRRDFGKGHEKEIRKRFYGKMRKGISDGLPIRSSSSPQQIRDILRSSGDDITELTKEYERVRYNGGDKNV